MKKVIPVIFLVGLGVYLYAKTYVAKLNFDINRVQLDSAATLASGFSKIVLHTTLSIQNPNAVALDINHYQADFYYQGVKVATVTGLQPLEVNAGQFISGDQILNINTLTAVPAVLKLLDTIKNGLPVSFDVKGTVDTSLFGKIPITKTVSLT